MKPMLWLFRVQAVFILGLPQTLPLKPMAPIEPISAIADAFKTVPVIGMQAGVGHTDARGFAFMIALLRDPRIQSLGVDIAMENGSARYQSVMDRYTRGEDVPYSELRHVWDETTQPQTATPIGDINPIYWAIREIKRHAAPRPAVACAPGRPAD